MQRHRQARQRASRPLALLLGVGAFVAGASLVWGQRGSATFGWFAYAPLNSTATYTSSDGAYMSSFDIRGPNSLLAGAFPGVLALLLAGLLTLSAALWRRRVLLIALASAAAAAAAAPPPGLDTTIRHLLVRLLVVLLPAGLALVVRRWLERQWPWRTTDGVMDADGDPLTA